MEICTLHEFTKNVRSLKDLPTKLLLITSGLLHCPYARLTPISQLQRITELSVEFIGTNMRSADLFNATMHTERVFSRIYYGRMYPSSFADYNMTSELSFKASLSHNSI